jgi:anti-anti-sigma regulatory factor
MGELRTAPPLRHVCWAYDDGAAFDECAEGFFAEGTAKGERAWYIGTRRPAWLRRDEDFVRLSSAYGAGPVVDPAAQVDAYAAATEDALAAGYTGLRVVADATTLVGTPAQLDAFARYEHRIDRYMRDHAFTAVCAYDRGVLGERTVAELACMHPDSNVDVLFHLFNGAAGETVLAGELDTSVRELLADALERADPPARDGRLTVDASALRFIDHQTLCDLQAYALARGTDIVLTAAPAAAARLVDLLELTAVRVEAAR